MFSKKSTRTVQNQTLVVMIKLIIIIFIDDYHFFFFKLVIRTIGVHPCHVFVLLAERSLSFIWHFLRVQFGFGELKKFCDFYGYFEYT